jgi:hypothetical protein
MEKRIMEAPKIVSQLEVVSRLENDINLAISTIEELLPQLKHGESKRLFLAATKYPMEDTDFSGESEALIRSFSASKNVKDALVAMGVEVVIKQIIEQQQAAGNVPVVDEELVAIQPSTEIFPATETIEEMAKAAQKKRKTKKAE